MPAYRSTEEAEVRDAVVARLRALRPGARIIHEINVAGTGSNRIDVLAVDRAEIIAVEVKSVKDKLDRLPDQIKAMRGVAHHVVSAIHEKHLVKQPDEWTRADVVGIPERVSKGSTEWIYPEVARPGHWGWRWQDLRPAPMTALPATAIEMLWHEELLALCERLCLAMPKRATRGHMITGLRWGATGAQITKGICDALRARRCTEADQPIEAAANDNAKEAQTQ